MELKEFAYELPQSLVAAFPAEGRDQARLMVVERDTGRIQHTVFSALRDFLSPGELLVLNDSRVFPARLRGRKESGGRVEVLLVERFPGRNDLWIALVDAAKPPRVGSRIFFTDDVWAEVNGDMRKGRYGLRFYHPGDFLDVLGRLGEPPLPPYIRRARDSSFLDWERYQTVYASAPGSIAAPTAGLHFTEDLLEELVCKGVETAFLTLHVGPGTFRPVGGERVEDHHMEGERYVLSTGTADAINRVKATGKRIIAVGSTTTRVLEGVVQRWGRVQAHRGMTRLFIRPDYSFRVIDGLVTNFHLPASTPLILVAAFGGLGLIRQAYQEAVRLGYRFYSYGDAMLVV